MGMRDEETGGGWYHANQFSLDPGSFSSSQEFHALWLEQDNASFQ